jgi:hypothetical protein
LWADDLFLFPVDREIALFIALLCARLPVRRTADRPLKRDAVLAPTADEQIGIDVGGVDEVLARQQSLAG